MCVLVKVRGLKEGIMSTLSGLEVSAEGKLERNRKSSFTTVEGEKGKQHKSKVYSVKRKDTR